MRRTVLFTWWMDVHVLKAYEYICYQSTLLPESSTVYDNLKKGIYIYNNTFSVFAL